MIPSANLSSWRYPLTVAAAEVEANKSVLVNGATHDVHRLFFTVPASLSEEYRVLAERHVCMKCRSCVGQSEDLPFAFFVLARLRCSPTERLHTPT